MAATKTDTAPQTKKFGKGERTVPHPSVRARRFYPAEDESAPKKVRGNAGSAVLPVLRCNGCDGRLGCGDRA